jgi:hypothetical protein
MKGGSFRFAAAVSPAVHSAVEPARSLALSAYSAGAAVLAFTSIQILVFVLRPFVKGKCCARGQLADALLVKFQESHVHAALLAGCALLIWSASVSLLASNTQTSCHDSLASAGSFVSHSSDSLSDVQLTAFIGNINSQIGQLCSEVSSQIVQYESSLDGVLNSTINNVNAALSFLIFKMLGSLVAKTNTQLKKAWKNTAFTSVLVRRLRFSYRQGQRSPLPRLMFHFQRSGRPI